MKFTLEQSENYNEVEIIIKCNVVDDKLQKLISQIRLYSFSVVGKKEGETHIIPIENVYYFESVDDKTFIYLEKDVMETENKIYELERVLTDVRYVRISKSTILNIEQLVSVKAMLNGKYEVTLKNGEKLIVNRHYVAQFKEKFGMRTKI